MVVSSMAFCESCRLSPVSSAVFWANFRRFALNNSLHVCLQNGILWARPTKSSAISWFLSEFQVFGPWYLSEFVRRLPLKFSLEHGRSPCWSHCGRSKWRGLALLACVSKQPRDSSNSGWVTSSCVSKAQSSGGVMLWDLTLIRECGLLKWDLIVLDALAIFSLD